MVSEETSSVDKVNHVYLGSVKRMIEADAPGDGLEDKGRSHEYLEAVSETAAAHPAASRRGIQGAAA